jgi:hypothetical protein
MTTGEYFVRHNKSSKAVGHSIALCAQTTGGFFCDEVKASFGLISTDKN